ncbi:hypothetical protein SDC9_210091 [bioreactor metagenome]|uniref:Uncharacterized protein n=1 Tax=bioreactor metagenome TaxID=1076179 RepID=A0A645JQ05_9ZZZZ
MCSRKGMFFAEFTPVIHLVFRQNDNNIHFPVVFQKNSDGMHQDRFVFYFDKLFRDRTLHSFTFSARNNNNSFRFVCHTNDYFLLNKDNKINI